MSSHMKFYIFSDPTLRLREVKFFRTKILGSGLLLGVAIVGAVLLLNYFAGDVLGLGYNRLALLNTENRMLKDQLSEISQRMVKVQHALETLSDRGNELRLMADL